MRSVFFIGIQEQRLQRKRRRRLSGETQRGCFNDFNLIFEINLTFIDISQKHSEHQY